MNSYRLKVTFKSSDSFPNVKLQEFWGPYDTREQAVAILRKNEYSPNIIDIELETC